MDESQGALPNIPRDRRTVLFGKKKDDILVVNLIH
jgi:hypothetical protein